MAATFRIGLKNILGSNWTRTHHRWSGRSVMLEREMHAPGGMDASVYFLIEVNRRAERRSLAAMLPGWDVIRSRGCNDIYSDPAVHRPVSWVEIPLGTRTGQERYVTVARFEHLPTGIQWTGATTHLSSSVGTTSELAEASRTVQGRRLVEVCGEHQVDVLTGDINNIAVRPDTPRGLVEVAGYVDWRTATAVANADYDTHRPIGEPLRRAGRHIDAIYLGQRVQASSAKVHIEEPGSSDHLGLSCQVTIDA